MAAKPPKQLHPSHEAKERGLRMVGKIKDAHGIRGELYVLIFSGETSWLDKLKSLQLYRAQSPGWVELALKSVRPHKKGLIAKTETLADRTEAETYKGSEFFIPEEFLISEPGEGIYLAEVEGFKVIQKDQGEIGKVTGFSSNGIQDLLVITNDKGEFEVPLVEPLIVEIRFEQNEIEMDLPEGLVEYE